jgi:lysophospholipid acyltransferase (LPLAT)-like uncharacterized protein
MRIKPPLGLLHHVAWSLVRSLRVHRFGWKNLLHARTLTPGGGMVAITWHQNLFCVLTPHHHMKIAALASLSGDGAIIAEHLQRSGIRVVRGSSSRGAAKAAAELYRALDDGWLVALACDGPKGPARVVKEGPIEIARRAGVPLLLSAARATREYSFKRAWDGFRLPLPRAHVAIVYDRPILFPPHEPTPDELAERRRMVAERLNQLEAEAERRCRREAP